MSIKRLKDFPSANTSALSNDDIFLMMDDPSGSGITKKVSLSTLSSVLTNTSLVAGSGINLSYNELENSLSIHSTGGGAGGAGVAVTTIVQVDFSTTINIDSTEGDIFDIVLTDNVIINNPINPVDGKTIRLRISQDATGNRTITLGNKFNIPSSASSPLPWSTTPNKMDTLAATYHSARDKWDIVAFVPGY